MLVLGGCYFVAGAFVGAWIMHVTAKIKSTAVGVPNPTAAITLSPVLGPTFGIPPLHFDPVRAVLPDSKLTPGDTLSGVNG